MMKRRPPSLMRVARTCTWSYEWTTSKRRARLKTKFLSLRPSKYAEAANQGAARGEIASRLVILRQPSSRGWGHS